MLIDAVDVVADVLYADARYKILYGGRGSTKSWSIADYEVQNAAYSNKRILCTREIQSSIKDSVYRLIVDTIFKHKIENNFIINKDAILGIYGSEFIFKGLRHNISEVKSMEGIDSCWVEEGERISHESVDILIPTIRKPNSEIIISFNPEDENSAVYTNFVEKDGKPVVRDDMRRAFVNWWDNPWFPDVLRREMEWCRRNDPEKYEHVWGGRPKKYGQAVIFKNKLRVEDFEPAGEGTQFYYGADWGFGVDPSCLVRLFIRDRKLYLDKEFYGYGIEIDDLPRCFDTVPGSRNWTIYGDSSRPDTISYMCNHGFMVEGAVKGKDSVEDGIEFLKNFEAIIIHPECVGSIGDFSNYRYKTDKITGVILPIPIDKSNHSVDACRYGLEPWRLGGMSIFDAL